MNTSEILQLVNKTLKDCGIVEFIPIRVEFNNRFTSRIADARYYSSIKYGVIRISSKLWNRLPLEEQINTVVHETCHIAVKYLYGNKASSHGWTWKSLMLKCGQNPSRCAKVDRTGLVSTFGVQCSCGVLNIGRTQYRRFLGGKKYRCKR